MSSSQNLAAEAAAIIIFGHLQSPITPDAASFRAEAADKVSDVTRQLGHSVLAVAPNADAAIIAKPKEGQPQSGASLALGSIDAQTLDRLLRPSGAARAATDADETTPSSAQATSELAIDVASSAAPVGAPSEAIETDQQKQSGKKGVVPAKALAASASRRASTSPTGQPQLAKEPRRLEPGKKVLAADLDENGEPVSWWDGVIVRVDHGAYVVRWRDWPKEKPVRRVPEHVAIKLTDL